MKNSSAELPRSFGPIYRHVSRCGRELSAPAKLVLLNLLERLGKNASVWSSQALIAHDTGLSKPTVRKAVAELSGLGFISQRRRGLGNTNKYFVNLEPLLAWAEKGNERTSRGEEFCQPEGNESSPEDPTEKIHQQSFLVLKEPPIRAKPKSLSNPKTRFTPEDRARLVREHSGKGVDVEAAIDKAMNSPGYTFGNDKLGHIERWLAEDIDYAKGRRGHETPGNISRGRAQPQQSGSPPPAAPGRAPDLVG